MTLTPPHSQKPFEAKNIRRGEELDAARVTAWLRTILPDLEGTPEVTQYAGGASNWTYRLVYPNHDLVLRRPPAGTKAKSAHDMGREYRVQAALKDVYPVVPKMIGLCRDESIIGAEFYVMERIAGLICRKNLPDGVNLNRSEVRTLCTNVLDRLIDLHQVDVKSVGLDSLGKGPGYAERQVSGWSDRYEKARTWNVPSFAKVRAFLRENIPQDAGAVLIHNDYRFDNVVLDPLAPTRVVGVLDWEMATVGCPLMDLGNSLAYWVEPDDDFVMRSMRRQPTHVPGMLSRQEVITYYFEKSGRTPVDFTFYQIYGLFRLAVIGQQIYYRYHHKQTQNPSFRHFWLLVCYLERRCRKLLGQRQ